jgi:hypothetical protein
MRFWKTLLMTICALPGLALAEPARTVQFEMESKALAGNLVGVATRRAIQVRLPAGYDNSGRRYPVVYYFHNMFSSPERLFGEHKLAEIFERGMARGVLGEVILVAGDFTTPNQFNFFGNTVVAGRWMDHIVQELVPAVDARFRTLATPASRAATGDFFGGFAALKMGLWHPDVFAVVYALHPVATGTGLQPGYWRPNWELVHAARTPDDLAKDVYAPIFVAMAQAYLPNPARPPFYCDFMVEREGGALAPNARNIATLNGNFLLDAQLPARAESLKKLRALKMDWGRYDPTVGHVYSAQAFTRKLSELGVKHFAEEYSGTDRDQLWIEDGRVEGDLLPFIGRYLEGAAPLRRGMPEN